MAGVEKVAATRVSEAFLERPYSECKSLEGKGSLVEKHDIHFLFLTKKFLRWCILDSF